MQFDLEALGYWRDLPFFDTDLPTIEAELSRESTALLPPREQVFRALEMVPPEAVRVVILGQDPYPTPGHAHGLAFSADPSLRPLPKSLANIYREMVEDIGTCPPNADLTFWADQGVLLLNTILTIPKGAKPNAHKALGWQTLTQQVLAHLSRSPRAYVLWGRPAQKFLPDELSDNLIIRSPHPSPLSAYRGFFGSRPFSKVNVWLQERGGTAINWANPEAP